MAARASWKGFLNLSLVSVPVKAYSASNSGSEIHLNQLHARCNSRIRQKLTCPLCGDVERDEIVKGYEYAKDQYVVVDLDELEKLRSQDDSRAIKIDKFIQPDAIDPIYWSDSSYYLLPEGAAGQKPYALLHQTMVQRNVHCVARVVLFNKEQLVLVRPLEKLLCMTVLKYANQIKATSAFDDERTEAAVSEAELALASTLVAETTTDEFDLGEYKDQYTEKLTQLIEAKVHGQQIVEAPSLEAPTVINLMDALKASVEKAQQARGGVRAPAAAEPAAPAAAAESKPASKSKQALVETLANPETGKRTAKRKTKTG